MVGVTPRQLFDRHLLRLVVRQAQVAVSALQRFFRFLQVVDGRDLVDGGLENRLEARS